MKKLSLFLLAALALTVGCRKPNDDHQKDLRDFKQVNLVSNVKKYNPEHIDTALKNAWGLAWLPAGIAYINANGQGVTDVYSGEGVMKRPPINIPTPTDTTGGPASGIVYNGGQGFKLKNGKPARFLFVTEEGVLAGWNDKSGNNAELIKDLSATSEFKGLAINSWGDNTYIYATDFKTNKVVVWDADFHKQSFAFNDPDIPAGYAPFGIQSVGAWLYVTYAKVGPTFDDVKGPGNGFVDIFTANGTFVRRFASRGTLNSPWGITAANSTFLDANDMEKEDGSGPDFSQALHMGKDIIHHENDDDDVILVGNFGDGHINVYNLSGRFLGQLKSHSHTICIDGLWALSFAPSTSSIDPSRLYFTAGPDMEQNGLFGYLKK